MYRKKRDNLQKVRELKKYKEQKHYLPNDTTTSHCLTLNYSQ